MSEPLSMWGLILNASWVVKGVMLMLMLASLVSWVLVFQRMQVLKRARRALLAFEQEFWSGIDLNDLYRRLESEGDTLGAENIFRAGFREFSRLRQKEYAPDAIMEGVQRAMRVALVREEEHLNTSLPFLASVGSTSPYVGLFGTVWGIMESFRGLANVQQATLAAVAPGISEALIATAMGLFAAIPAVLAYNRFATRAETLVVQYETFADEFSSILHRNVYVH
ncbi:biopolymer transport protein TolQ [Allopseudospirillum japonicum]|uniref:Tol-Pal system protein TolQ n=2 Tax=Allopseudospirillum japonicum TaxID=64971 RepID=A0A1H6Q2C5_9GAMM|nr:protein TolQ [Allopseudospirillum japonicum]SEI37991.1 biopolymer transport protein TolQ [Allopseudospirillum japonicum]